MADSANLDRAALVTADAASADLNSGSLDRVDLDSVDLDSAALDSIDAEAEAAVPMDGVGRMNTGKRDMRTTKSFLVEWQANLAR